MAEHLTCQQPDVDAPKLKCGYPIPCPYHTAQIDTAGQVIPPQVPSSLTAHLRLGQIADAFRDHQA